MYIFDAVWCVSELEKVLFDLLTCIYLVYLSTTYFNYGNDCITKNVDKQIHIEPTCRNVIMTFSEFNFQRM